MMQHPSYPKRLFFSACYRGGGDRRGDIREALQTGGPAHVPEPSRPAALPVDGEHRVQRQVPSPEAARQAALEPGTEAERPAGAEASEAGAPPQDVPEAEQGRTMFDRVIAAVEDPRAEHLEKFLGRRAGHREEELAQQHGAPEADRAAERVRGAARAGAGGRD